MLIRTALVLLLTVGQAAAKPARVVSLNLCADQFVVALAERERIAALSPLAVDPALSAVAAEAAGIPRVRTVAEEVLPLNPDLAIVGPWGAARVAAMLEARGVAVLRLGLAEDFDAILRHLRSVAAALGETARGEALAASIARDLAAIRRRADAPRALVWQARGFVPGRGTLPDAVLRAAGLGNAAPFAGYGFVSLERLLADPPDLLVTAPAAGPPSLSEALLEHPALARAAIPRARIDPAWLACGGPETVRAAAALAR
ncbi:ABC transporter substrate-binding protein [Elioraea tepidiphila]|uniref:ABC transporter substrate-binding protein n=1 Tax=Elioraea tepidiphila TaxID=457934 RepID=UPI000477FBFD|nr:ABC transporter substrate-binding protein [Elioraea tepidiphila]